LGRGEQRGKPRLPGRRRPIYERSLQNAAPFQVDQPGSQRHEIDPEQLRHLGLRVNRWAHQQLEKATDRRFHHGATVRINPDTRQSILGMSGMPDRLRMRQTAVRVASTGFAEKYAGNVQA